MKDLLPPKICFPLRKVSENTPIICLTLNLCFGLHFKDEQLHAKV